MDERSMIVFMFFFGNAAVITMLAVFAMPFLDDLLLLVLIFVGCFIVSVIPGTLSPPDWKMGQSFLIIGIGAFFTLMIILVILFDLLESKNSTSVIQGMATFALAFTFVSQSGFILGNKLVVKLIK